MNLRNVASGEELKAVIAPLNKRDYATIKKDKVRFDKFDWSKYKDQEVFKIHLENDDTILGLMCLIDHTDDVTNAIEIGLLEVSAENIGAKKKLDDIAGCLIAFACRESFKRGHEGCVFLTPKTSLISHYQKKYGFYHMELKISGRPDGFMILYDREARKIIKRYLD